MLLTIVLVLILISSACSAATQVDDSMKPILEAAEVQRGLVVLLQNQDDVLLSKLNRIPGTLVQTLPPTSRSHFDDRQLPYIDNLVNLLVVSKPVGITHQEMLRALVPGGLALIQQDDGWQRLVKPQQSGTDQWTHFLHGPDNNPVAADKRVDSPTGLQWIESPTWTRDHDSTPSIFGLVSAQGRLFYILDEGPIGMIEKRLPTSHVLIARDAYNGVLLWKRRLPDWYPTHVQWGTTPVHLHRRLVAVDDRVYVTDGLQGPVLALDATTGETRQTYAASEGAAELLVDHNRLIVGIMNTESRPGDAYPASREQAFKGARLLKYQSRGSSLAVYDAETGERRWSQVCPFIPTMICSDKNRVFYATDKGLACVDLQTGAPHWESAESATKLIVHDDVVVTARESDAAKRTPKIVVQARVADSGALLWEASGQTLPTFGNVFYIPPEMFVARNSVWINAAAAGEIIGLDLHTGKTKQSLSTKGGFTPGHHVRCYPAKATERFAMFNKRGIEFLEFTGQGGITKHDWVRGACRLGVLPCNGMIYVPPHGCNCCVETYLRGFHTLNSESSPEPIADVQRLLRGPEFGRVTTSRDTSGSQDWPAFRYDSTRSCGTEVDINGPFEQRWIKSFPGRVTSPTVAADRVFVSEVDACTVHAIDVKTGQACWSYRADGRVDSPPTLVGDLAVFGAADGCVYCLRSSDGSLAWRFQAAPADRRLVAFGQVESVWPCHGSVLVEQGIVYVTAGRSSYLNGGIGLYALDLLSGKILHQNAIHSQQPQETTLKDTFNNWGALTDILVSDGEHLFMRHLKLDDELNLLSPLYPLNDQNRANGLRVMASAGFLDTTGNKRVYRAAAESWTGRYSALRTQQLALGDGITYGCRIHYDRGWKSPRYHSGDGTLVFAQEHAAAAKLSRELTDEATTLGNGRRWEFDIPHESFRWERRLPICAQTTVLAGDKLLVAGRPDRTIEDTVAFAEGHATGELWGLSTADGEVLFQQQLSSSPILDGMIVVDGAVFVCTADCELVRLRGALPASSRSIEN